MAITKRGNAANKKMADSEDEPEYEVDQKLSKSHKFALYNDFEGFAGFRPPL